MDFDPATIVAHIASATGGGITVGWVAKLLLHNWLKKHKALEETVDKISRQLVRIETLLNGVVKTEERAIKLERETAVISERIDGVKKSVNTLGMKVRDLEHLRGAT